MLIRVVMFGCIIAGSLCSIVSVLSCLVACCKISVAIEINEELLLLLLLEPSSLCLFYFTRGSLTSTTFYTGNLLTLNCSRTECAQKTAAIVRHVSTATAMLR